MNWLAHILLSEENIDFQIGNFLADPLKAKAWENSSKELSLGMKTHLLIDSYSDKHKAFKRSKKRLKERGLLKGVIIDFTYDYLLSKNWSRFCNKDLNSFKEEFYLKALKQKELYPSWPKQIVSNMVNKDLLNYSCFSHLEEAFIRLDKRLSPRLLQRDNALSYLELVKKNIDKLEEDFLEFFPELITYISKDLDKKKLKHLRF